LIFFFFFFFSKTYVDGVINSHVRISDHSWMLSITLLNIPQPFIKHAIHLRAVQRERIGVLSARLAGVQLAQLRRIARNLRQTKLCTMRLDINTKNIRIFSLRERSFVLGQFELSAWPACGSARAPTRVDIARFLRVALESVPTSPLLSEFAQCKNPTSQMLTLSVGVILLALISLAQAQG
jgi:hypothetical protein